MQRKELTDPLDIHDLAIPRDLYVGLERVNLGSLRAAAALALGASNSSAALPALRKVLNEEETRSSQPYQAMAIMALGQLGDRASLLGLGQVLRPTAALGKMTLKDRLASPLRGFAALALGLLSRPIQNPQLPDSKELIDPPEAGQVCTLLGQVLVDGNETSEVRAACALALGLAGQTENLKYLQAVSDHLKQSDGVLGGYVLLARGMLADQSILTPAKALLGPERPPADLPALIGARATMLGLGLVGSNEAIPILNNAWKRGILVGKDAALALGLREDPDASVALVDLLKNGPTPQAKILAAEALGEIFIKSRPSRLASLVNGTNYMMKNAALGPYQTVANEFLMTTLVPGTRSWDPRTAAWVTTGDQWKNQDLWERAQHRELLKVIWEQNVDGPQDSRAFRSPWSLPMLRYPSHEEIERLGGDDPLIHHNYSPLDYYEQN